MLEITIINHTARLIKSTSIFSSNRWSTIQLFGHGKINRNTLDYFAIMILLKRIYLTVDTST